MIKCSLLPQLTATEKQQLEEFLVETLGTDELCGSYPLGNKISIYLDGSVKTLQAGQWQLYGSSTLYLAEDYVYNVPHETRLAVLLTLTQLCEPSEELTRAGSGAVIRYLTKQYQEASGLIVSGAESSGIAFNSKDMSAAACVGGEWLLPSGEAVDVSGPEWTVCETVVPPVGETPVEAGATPRAFRVGDRVHYESIPGVPSELAGDGVIDYIDEEGQINVSPDTGGAWSFQPDQLSLIPTPVVDDDIQF